MEAKKVPAAAAAAAAAAEVKTAPSVEGAPPVEEAHQSWVDGFDETEEPDVDCASSTEVPEGDEAARTPPATFARIPPAPQQIGRSYRVVGGQDQDGWMTARGRGRGRGYPRGGDYPRGGGYHRGGYRRGGGYSRGGYYGPVRQEQMPPRGCVSRRLDFDKVSSERMAPPVPRAVRVPCRPNVGPNVGGEAPPEGMAPPACRPNVSLNVGGEAPPEGMAPPEYDEGYAPEDEGRARPEPLQSIDIQDTIARILDEMPGISTYAARAWLIRWYRIKWFTPELLAEYYVSFIQQVNGQPSDLFCEIYHQALCHVLGVRHLCDIAIPTEQFVKLKSEFWRMTTRDVLERRMWDRIREWARISADDVQPYIEMWNSEYCMKDSVVE